MYFYNIIFFELLVFWYLLDPVYLLRIFYRHHSYPYSVNEYAWWFLLFHHQSDALGLIFRKIPLIMLVRHKYRLIDRHCRGIFVKYLLFYYTVHRWSHQYLRESFLLSFFVFLENMHFLYIAQWSSNLRVWSFMLIYSLLGWLSLRKYLYQNVHKIVYLRLQ